MVRQVELICNRSIPFSLQMVASPSGTASTQYFIYCTAYIFGTWFFLNFRETHALNLRTISGTMGSSKTRTEIV